MPLIIFLRRQFERMASIVHHRAQRGSGRRPVKSLAHSGAAFNPGQRNAVPAHVNLDFDYQILGLPRSGRNVPAFANLRLDQIDLEIVMRSLNDGFVGLLAMAFGKFRQEIVLGPLFVLLLFAGAVVFRFSTVFKTDANGSGGFGLRFGPTLTSAPGAFGFSIGFGFSDLVRFFSRPRIGKDGGLRLRCGFRFWRGLRLRRFRIWFCIWWFRLRFRLDRGQACLIGDRDLLDQLDHDRVLFQVRTGLKKRKPKGNDGDQRAVRED